MSHPPSSSQSLDRHQSVGKADEPWLHALLLAVGKRTGLAALINTSFNTRGKPITNTAPLSKTWRNKNVCGFKIDLLQRSK